MVFQSAGDIFLDGYSIEGLRAGLNANDLIGCIKRTSSDLQGYIGGTWRSLIDKNTATFIVAKDGSGNYVDIQSALNALSESGGCIYVKEGVYDISSTILIEFFDGLSIIGSGPTTILRLVAGANVHVMQIRYTDHVYLANFVISGNKLQQTVTVDGIYVETEGTNFSFHNLEIRNVRGHGICFSKRNAYSFLIGNYVRNCDLDGIFCQDGNNSIIQGNLCRSNEGNGIRIHGGYSLTLSGNCCYSNKIDGVKLSGTANKHTVVGNACVDNIGYGIREVDTANYNVIVGNCLRDNFAGSLLTIGANSEVAHNVV